MSQHGNAWQGWLSGAWRIFSIAKWILKGVHAAGHKPAAQVNGQATGVDLWTVAPRCGHG